MAEGEALPGLEPPHRDLQVAVLRALLREQGRDEAHLGHQLTPGGQRGAGGGGLPPALAAVERDGEAVDPQRHADSRGGGAARPGGLLPAHQHVRELRGAFRAEVCARRKELCALRLLLLTAAVLRFVRAPSPEDGLRQEVLVARGDEPVKHLRAAQLLLGLRRRSRGLPRGLGLGSRRQRSGGQPRRLPQRRHLPRPQVRLQRGHGGLHLEGRRAPARGRADHGGGRGAAAKAAAHERLLLLCAPALCRG
mmetsp:Transcript_6982/g.16783  ORF Transcript_6982/g.16783 Transcript_6982/m.16783 type:complete len:251 (-) Transcript_6982:1107-1859(-)